jgi:hypothetical protein
VLGCIFSVSETKHWIGRHLPLRSVVSSYVSGQQSKCGVKDRWIGLALLSFLLDVIILFDSVVVPECAAIDAVYNCSPMLTAI